MSNTPRTDDFERIAITTARAIARTCAFRSAMNHARVLEAINADLLEALQAIVDADALGKLCYDEIAQAIDALAKARNA